MTLSLFVFHIHFIISIPHSPSVTLKAYQGGTSFPCSNDYITPNAFKHTVFFKTLTAQLCELYYNICLSLGRAAISSSQHTIWRIEVTENSEAGSPSVITWQSNKHHKVYPSSQACCILMITAAFRKQPSSYRTAGASKIEVITDRPLPPFFLMDGNHEFFAYLSKERAQYGHIQWLRKDFGTYLFFENAPFVWELWKRGWESAQCPSCAETVLHSLAQIYSSKRVWWSQPWGNPLQSQETIHRKATKKHSWWSQQVYEQWLSWREMMALILSSCPLKRLPLHRVYFIWLIAFILYPNMSLKLCRIGLSRKCSKQGCRKVKEMLAER